MSLYNPPTHIVARLTQFDPLLRIRWGDHSLCWLFERKLTKDRWVDPGSYSDRQGDEFIAARDGYVEVLRCEKEQLDERVFFTLWCSDVWRHGGAAKTDRLLRAHEESVKAGKRAKFLDDCYDMAIERYNFANTLTATKHELHPDKVS